MKQRANVHMWQRISPPVGNCKSYAEQINVLLRGPIYSSFHRHRMHRTASHNLRESLQNCGRRPEGRKRNKKKTEKKIRECEMPISVFYALRRAAEWKWKYSLQLDSRMRSAVGNDQNMKFHPNWICMHQMAEYRIEIDIQFIIIIRSLAIYQLAVRACIRFYGTIASRAFVRVYINEFIIIISFMRAHFSPVGHSRCCWCSRRLRCIKDVRNHVLFCLRNSSALFSLHLLR